MTNWIQEKYINLISNRFHIFKDKGNHTYNVDCPYCHEYETSSKKHSARGYFLDEGSYFRYYCHRCGVNKQFNIFLKEQDYRVYKEYIIEILKNRNKSKKEIDFKISKKISVSNELNNPLKLLINIKDLPNNHYAKKYIQTRKIPENVDLYLAENFKSWINELIPKKFENMNKDHSRLIIPFFAKDNKLHAIQGRSFSNEQSPKYLTILLNENYPSIYGLNKLDQSKPIYVTEGPIDSFFIDNCIASCGGNIYSKLDIFNKQSLHLIFDNEPRSIHTIEKLYNAIKLGYNVVIWPDSFKYKDINDAIINNVSSNEIENIIKSHSFSGLSALLALSSWSKTKRGFYEVRRFKNN